MYTLGGSYVHTSDAEKECLILRTMVKLLMFFSPRELRGRALPKKNVGRRHIGGKSAIFLSTTLSEHGRISPKCSPSPPPPLCMTIDNDRGSVSVYVCTYVCRYASYLTSTSPLSMTAVRLASVTKVGRDLSKQRIFTTAVFAHRRTVETPSYST